VVGVGEGQPAVGSVRLQRECVLEIRYRVTIGTSGGAPARYVARRMLAEKCRRSVVACSPTRTLLPCAGVHP